MKKLSVYREVNPHCVDSQARILPLRYILWREITLHTSYIVIENIECTQAQ